MNLLREVNLLGNYCLLFTVSSLCKVKFGKALLQIQKEFKSFKQEVLRNFFQPVTHYGMACLLTVTLTICEPQVDVQSTGNSESYQERLSRLEGDKESLVLQVKHMGDL